MSIIETILVGFCYIMAAITIISCLAGACLALYMKDKERIEHERKNSREQAEGGENRPAVYKRRRTAC